MDRHAHGHFGWADLTASDMEGQSTFYQDLFGWNSHDEPTDMGPPYRMYMLADENVAGAGPLPPDMKAQGMPTMWNSYVTVDSVDDIVARATELGGQVTMPTMDVMEFGRMVGITDPTGAMLFFWEPQGHPGADVFNQPGSLTWNDLNTRDMAAAADYYEALLGWQIDRSGEHDSDYWAISVDGVPEGGIMQMPEGMPDDVPAHWLVYFASADARGDTEKARQLGGTVEMEPMEIPVAIFSVISDPAGATFAVMQNKPM